MREIWFALLLLTAAVFPAAAQTSPPGTGTASVLDAAPQDRVLGQADAPVTIIEYASLTCPHCAHFHRDVVPLLQDKWIGPGKAKLIMRPFPLDEPALRAEMLARCAPPQRYYPLIDTLFRTQESWAFARDWRGALERTARVAGVSPKEFEACLANKALEDQIVQSRLTAATQLDVNATPTIFVNGKKFEGRPTAEAFDQFVSSLAPKS